MNILRAFIPNRRGATMVEYALIAALLVLGLVVSLTTLGTAVDANYQSIADAFN